MSSAFGQSHPIFAAFSSGSVWLGVPSYLVGLMVFGAFLVLSLGLTYFLVFGISAIVYTYFGVVGLYASSSFIALLHLVLCLALLGLVLWSQVKVWKALRIIDSKRGAWVFVLYTLASLIPVVGTVCFYRIRSKLVSGESSDVS